LQDVIDIFRVHDALLNKAANHLDLVTGQVPNSSGWAACRDVNIEDRKSGQHQGSSLF
jgi:hypothetical protein